MNRILVPVNFSTACEHTLQFAHDIANTLGVGIDLLHCFPVQAYNRMYNFGKQDYSLGIKDMLSNFYERNLPTSEITPNLYAKPGSVIENIAALSAEYQLVLISSNTFSEKAKQWLGSRATGIISTARCPVLIVSPVAHYHSWEKIWHIKRRDNEILRHRLNKLKIKPQLVQEKTFIQKTFTSAIWQKIVAYSNTPKESLPQAVKTNEFEEEVHLIILVCHEKESFLQFLRADAMQFIFQFPVPVLIFPMRKM